MNSKRPVKPVFRCHLNDSNHAQICRSAIPGACCAEYLISFAQISTACQISQSVRLYPQNLPPSRNWSYQYASIGAKCTLPVHICAASTYTLCPRCSIQDLGYNRDHGRRNVTRSYRIRCEGVHAHRFLRKEDVYNVSNFLKLMDRASTNTRQAIYMRWVWSNINVCSGLPLPLSYCGCQRSPVLTSSTKDLYNLICHQ